MSDVSLTLQNAAGVYLAITETPAVVTLSAPVVSGALAATVTVANVVSVNVVTMPAITVQAAAPSVTTVAGTVTANILNTINANIVNNNFNSRLYVDSRTRNYGSDGDPWVYIPNLTILHEDYGTINCSNYYRWDGSNTTSQWYPRFPASFYAYTWINFVDLNDNLYTFQLLYNDGNGIDIVLANSQSGTAEFPTTGWNVVSGSTIASGALVFTLLSKDIQQVGGTVTASIANSVTIGSLPVQLSTTTIGRTARLNVTLSSATTIGATVPSYGNLYGGSDGTNLRAILVDSSGRTTVTGSVSVLGTPSVTMGAISGTVTANLTSVPTHAVTLASTTVTVSSLPALAAGTAQIGSVTASISGTVTVSSTTVTVSAMPSGALTTRFGSVVTANTAGITSAVTNASRKYLLVQNISTGTVTIGIGFSPTTTQGIQLTAGAGLTFDSFVPTGAVYWLGATTGAAYTILEG
jgi:hypothetical protein